MEKKKIWQGVRNVEGQKHSPLGIASFMIAVVSALGLAGALIGAASMAADLALAMPESLDPNGLPDLSNSGLGTLAVLGLVIMLLIFAALAGAVIGLAGLFQKQRLKLFSVLGLVFNSLIVLGFLLLLIAGTLLGPALPGVWGS